MNWVDIMIIVLVAGLGFMGWRNGVIRWAVTVIGGIIGLVLAGRLYTSVATLFSPVSDSEGVQQVLGFGTIFVIALVVAWIIGRIIKTALNIVMMGWIDNLAGLVLGAFGGVFAAAAIISVMGIVPSQSLEEAVAESSMAEPVIKGFGVMRSLLPGEFDNVTDLFKPLIGNGE